MKFSISWLKRYLDIDKTPAEIEEALNLSGLEVEEVITQGLPQLENVVVGEVVTREQHPNADRLSVCEVTTGGEENHSIVCGAQNFKVGDRVPVALVGAVLPGDFKIKKSKLRGVKSEGMMCSSKELNLGSDHSGLLILEESPEIGTPINDVFPDGETVFDLAVTPNRPDALSVIGIARELAALFNLKIKKPELQETSSPKEGSSGLLQDIAVHDTDFCPHYTAHCIEGVKIGPSPKWLQEDLEAIGLRPINNVVDITNWILMETGQPLHAFDAAKLRGNHLQVRKAEDGEILTTLDEKERKLTSEMHVIADAERALVVAGVMGSIDAEVDDNTTDIVLEAAWFKPEAVRTTARKLGLSTDSSYRFERGVDQQGTHFAARRAIELILELAGGTYAGAPYVAGEPPAAQPPIETSPSYFNKKLGFEVEAETIQSILQKLGLAVEDQGGSWTVHIPTFRPDIERPIDLVEEFLRVYGTHNIPASPVQLTGLHTRDDGIAKFKVRVGKHLAANGFNECYVYSTRSQEDIESLFGEETVEKLRLANPLASDQTHLRGSLLPGLLETLRLNQTRGNDPLRLFEKGRTWHVQDGKVVEMETVAFVMMQEPLHRHWHPSPAQDFYSAKKVVFDILQQANVSGDKWNFEPLQSALWQDGHSATAGSLKSNLLLEFGILDHKKVSDLDIKGTVLAGTCHFGPKLLRAKSKTSEFEHFSDFPPANRDLALVMDADIPASKVLKQLDKAVQAACTADFSAETPTIFDHYQGEHLPEGRKSLAFAIQFRSHERTLKEKEVNKAFDEITNEMTTNTPYELRS